MEVRRIKRILQISRGEILRVIAVEGRWNMTDLRSKKIIHYRSNKICLLDGVMREGQNLNRTLRFLA